VAISALAGKPATKEMLVDLAWLERDYYEHKPEVGNPAERVSFGTSGHRRSSLRGSFTEAHIVAAEAGPWRDLSVSTDFEVGGGSKVYAWSEDESHESI
jgi:hypothetical protein